MRVGRETIQAWIRGIRAGTWEPSSATKRDLDHVLVDYLALREVIETDSRYGPIPQ